jgi:hypothetical protein
VSCLCKNATYMGEPDVYHIYHMSALYLRPILPVAHASVCKCSMIAVKHAARTRVLSQPTCRSEQLGEGTR